MSACCNEPNCRRTQPVTFYRGDFGGQVFAVTRYRVASDRGDGTATFRAVERHEVTDKLREFIVREREWVEQILGEEKP